MTEPDIHHSQTQEFCRLAQEVALENLKTMRRLQQPQQSFLGGAWFALGVFAVLGVQWVLK